MPTLQIDRSSEWTNYMRSIKIIMDGQEILKLKNGESKEITIPEGVHHLMARVDWGTCPIVSFQISGNEKKTFKLTSFAKHSRLGAFAALYYMVFASSRYLRLTEQN
jgi:hypothetical protein